MGENDNVVNELAQVVGREERTNVDLREPTQTKSEQLLAEIAKSRKKRKDGARGRVMSTYFSANDAVEIDQRCEASGLSTSGFLHEAVQRFLLQLRAEDGVMVLVTDGKGQEISAELTAQSQRKLDQLAEILTQEEKDAKLDLAFPETAEARRRLREASTSSVASQNAGGEDKAKDVEAT